MKKPDFEGWATKYGVRCADGLRICHNAFKDMDGQTVPMVWSHTHDDPEKVLGKMKLEHRNDGVYAYGYFNNSPAAQSAREAVRHKDVTSLSIYANHLTKAGPKATDVTHGLIREVSLVLAGANPQAMIVHADGLAHGDDAEDSLIIWADPSLEFRHDDMEIDEEEAISMADKTVGEVIDSMTEEQKNVLYAMVAEALDSSAAHDDMEDDADYDESEEYEDEDADYDDEDYEDYDDEYDDEEDDDMKHNIFDSETDTDVIAHDDMMAVIEDAKRYGSMKESALQHGITDVEWLFPDDKLLDAPPQWIRREDGWVSSVMNAVKHIPFARFKSMFADITEDEARAKGYIKGKLKKEQVFSLLKRSTTPQTIYKKQKMDRDDVSDITTFNVISWLKTEMRFMLDEEIARAILVGDGRLASDDDHISEDHIRPIWKDESLFTIKAPVTVPSGATADQRAKAIIRAAVKSRKEYKGSGNPAFFTTEDILTDMLLLEDNNGRVIYDSQDKLANALRVSKIVTVPVMEGLTRTDAETSKTYELLGIIVNLNDYTVGADKGGAVSMFDDFDIDYNAQKYLIETRCSGALTRPYSAIALEVEKTSA